MAPPSQSDVCKRPGAASRGVAPPLLGLATPIVTALAIAVTGCGSSEERSTTKPALLGMTSNDTPFYEDGNTTLFQVKRPIHLPIVAPSDAQRAALKETKVAPYGRQPWLTKDDVKVQVSWTLSNVDQAPHDVEILVDPWNEFVRYWPSINPGEIRTLPDLSGIDVMLRLEPLEKRSGTFTYDDMDELAIDLATVQNILADFAAHPPDPNAGDPGPSANMLVNHAFETHNRSSDGDLLSQPFIPGTIAGLVGFDLGLRTLEPANVAIEIVLELVDVSGDKVDHDALDPTVVAAGDMSEPHRVITPPPAMP